MTDTSKNTRPLVSPTRGTRKIILGKKTIILGNKKIILGNKTIILGNENKNSGEQE